MTEKQKYIGAFLDGYFHDKELDYNLLYFKIRDKAEKLAKKKWKKYIVFFIFISFLGRPLPR